MGREEMNDETLQAALELGEHRDFAAAAYLAALVRVQTQSAVCRNRADFLLQWFRTEELRGLGALPENTAKQIGAAPVQDRGEA